MIRLFVLKLDYIKDEFNDTLAYAKVVKKEIERINSNRVIFVADEYTIDKEYIKNLLENIGLVNIRNDSLNINLIKINTSGEIPFAYIAGANIIQDFLDKPLNEID